MTVTIATVPTATLKIIPDAVTAFRAQGHNERIRINDLSANDALETVLRGEADFGINIIGTSEPELEFQALGDDEFVLVLHRDDPLAAEEAIAWRDVDESRFVAVWKGSGNRMLIDRGLARAKHHLDWAYEVRHLSTALALVEAGVGITALPRSALAERNQSQVISRPLTDPVISRAMGTVRRTDTELSPVANAFFAILHETCSR
jgi:DNA-binding transcriptional LysR family regulator